MYVPCELLSDIQAVIYTGKLSVWVKERSQDWGYQIEYGEMRIVTHSM